MACGEELEREAREQARERAPATTAGEPDRATATAPGEADRAAAEAPRPEPATCPPGLAGCRAAEGVIIFVEAKDPDGDGDAHFVLESEEGITAPGISVIDVRRDLRPRPLPDPGDRISAAGPVYPGSYGQRQIEAVAVNATYSGPR